MGKKSRSTKAKSSDFQKVKLKVGKKRQLLNNATDIAFKSQSVYIPEQLKSLNHDENAVGEEFIQHKKNILELLGQVGHFNLNFRTDALTSLRISFANDKHLIQQFLPSIIQKVSRTISDENQQVRKSSISLFELLFRQLTEQEMSPFFSIVLSHLSCAMSHISDQVQRDSLKIADLCIKHFPKLLTNSARNTLLQQLIELISTKRTPRASNVNGAENEKGETRKLSMKLSSRESMLTWRNRILQRLFDLFSIAPESDKLSEISELQLKSLGQTDNLGYFPGNGNQAKWHSAKIGESLTGFVSWKLMKPAFSLRSYHANTISSLNKSEDSTSPWEMITTLFPLLFDCWHEATSAESRSLSIESIATMGSVLNIMNILVKRFIDSSEVKIEVIAQIRNRYLDNMRQYFFLSFPINGTSGQQRMPKKRKMTKDYKQDTAADVQTINLSICTLMTMLIPKDFIGCDADLLARTAEFLSMLLLSASSSRVSILDLKALEQCVTAIKQLLSIASDEATEESLLHPLLLLYQSTGYYSTEKATILRFFTKLYSPGQELTTRNSVVTEWLCSLPGFLIEILSNKVKGVTSGNSLETLCSDSKVTCLALDVLSCMRLACLHQNGHILASMVDGRAILLQLLRDYGSVAFCSPSQGKDSLCTECNNMQAGLFEILVYHSPMLSGADVTTLSQICHQTVMSAENVRYVAEMFLRRYEKAKIAEDFVTAIRFLCSVFIGCSMKALSNMKRFDMTQSYTFVDCRNAVEFIRHMDIVETLLLMLSTVDQISTLLSHFLCEKILNRFYTLPIISCYAILKSAEMLLSMGKLEDSQHHDLSKTIGKLVAALLVHLHIPTADPKDEFTTKIMLSTSLSLLQKNFAILHHSVMALTEPDFQTLNTWKATCSVVKYLASYARNLTECRQELEGLMHNLKQNSGPDMASLFESTRLHVSLLVPQVSQ